MNIMKFKHVKTGIIKTAKVSQINWDAKLWSPREATIAMLRIGFVRCGGKYK